MTSLNAVKPRIAPPPFDGGSGRGFRVRASFLLSADAEVDVVAPIQIIIASVIGIDAELFQYGPDQEAPQLIVIGVD